MICFDDRCHPQSSNNQSITHSCVKIRSKCIGISNMKELYGIKCTLYYLPFVVKTLRTRKLDSSLEITYRVTPHTDTLYACLNV